MTLGNTGVSIIIFSVGAITSAVPTMTFSPCWLIASQSKVTNFLSSRFLTTFMLIVMVSPIRTGALKRRGMGDIKG